MKSKAKPKREAKGRSKCVPSTRCSNWGCQSESLVIELAKSEKIISLVQKFFSTQDYEEAQDLQDEIHDQMIDKIAKGRKSATGVTLLQIIDEAQGILSSAGKAMDELYESEKFIKAIREGNISYSAINRMPYGISTEAPRNLLGRTLSLLQMLTHLV